MGKLTFWRKNYQNSFGISSAQVIIILGVLCFLGIAVIKFFNPIMFLQNMRDNKRKQDLVEVQQVLQEFYKENGKYPANNDKYEIVSIEADNPDKPWGSRWERYHITLPKDPDNMRTYRYISTGREQSYYLYANLELGDKDPQACNKGSACLSIPEGVICGNSEIDICNYGVSSPNTSP